MILKRSQFDQIQVRENETKELTSLLDQAPYEVEVSTKGHANAHFDFLLFRTLLKTVRAKSI